MRIGMDLDGVLANQLDYILPRVNETYGLQLRYEDIVDFRYRFAETDIYETILAAYDDPAYVRDMPLHPGAREAVETLAQRYEVYIVTARPDSVSEATDRWVRDRALDVAGIIHVEEAEKHLEDVDILVDDYTGNLRTFLEQTLRPAVILDQPWNRDRESLRIFVAHGRLQVAHTIDDVVPLVEQLVAAYPALVTSRGRVFTEGSNSGLATR